ncbi:MAG TPA: DNA polymerase III subunit gamma/tau [Anaeromyxobacteraceae bacterium]|jgi:DNA polymerase-3 subunit gamma/tau|nr:DNA polymerase III subunit gamma/tau [Anaeromyxobacteraceae bacterium]
MGYLVLARKYRPQTFGEMAGQEHVVRTLANALKSGQLAHAFLFTGPRGVGKTTSARLVAKALNCVKGPTATPCGECAPCVEIAEGRCVDVVEIDAASNNGVDNVRDIIEAVKYRPARDRYKVYVVDEVHMLSTGAFNALLKTLEEPPDHVKFVLATTDVHKVPETIVSRCQRFDFRRLTQQQIVDQLRKVAEAERMQVSDGALALVARAAEGGMRDALSLLDRVRAACGDDTSDAAVAEAVGAVDSAAVARLARALIGRDGAGLLAEVEALHSRGQEMRRVAEELARHLRDVVVARLVPAAPLDLSDLERKEVLAQAQAAEPAQLTRLFDLAQRAISEVKLSDQPRHALEVALLKGAYLAPGSEVGELVARLEAMAAGAPPAPRPPGGGSSGGGLSAAAAPLSAERANAGRAPEALPLHAERGEGRGGAPAAPAGFSPISAFGTPGCAAGTEPSPPPPAPGPRDDPSAPAAERWRAAVESVERQSPFVAQALKHAALLGIQGEEIALQLPRGSTMASAAERKRPEAEAALSSFFGRSVKLRFSLGDAAAPQAAAAQPAAPTSIIAAEKAERVARHARREAEARAHPNIQGAARILEGEIHRVDDL